MLGAVVPATALIINNGETEIQGCAARRARCQNFYSSGAGSVKGAGILSLPSSIFLPMEAPQHDITMLVWKVLQKNLMNLDWF